MLFNSHVFLLAFLPVALAGFFLLGRLRPTGPAKGWLLGASLLFYGWWSWTYLGLLLLSMLVNYALGHAVRAQREARPGTAAALLATGVVLNLALLGFYKYAPFVVNAAAALTGLEAAIDAWVLPLAISFYTFLQVAYLVDTWRGRSGEYGFIDYALFVTFFPHLIAGPIVHHHELIPQFRDRRVFRFQPEAAAAGVALLVIGLLKKLLLADPVSSLATPVFLGAADAPPALGEAWLATVAFALGLYFDFSAYSDMAIGLARMFGVQFPYNFHSPYKARSIIDFWRRWHMTLSRFLRDYLYIALGGSRRGASRRYANLMLTMLLGGLWHGAGWNFVVWGGLHGAFLVLNHGWNALGDRARAAGRDLSLGAVPARVLTLLAVLVAWVFFAAPDLPAASAVLGGMLGAHGLLSPHHAALFDALLRDGLPALAEHGVSRRSLAALAVLAVAAVTALAAPNSQQIVDGRRAEFTEPQRWTSLRFRPGLATATAAAAGLLVALSLMAQVREFVYFQF